MNAAEEIGKIIHDAFFDDGEFRNRLDGQLICHLRKAAQKASASNLFALSVVIADHPNSYLVSSFHAAKAIELLACRATESYKSGDYGVMGRLMTISHSFALEAVFGLDAARRFLQDPSVLKALGLPDGGHIESAFGESFPRLHEARNSLAHGDERVLNWVGVEGVGEDIYKMQMRVMASTTLTLRSKDGSEFKFSFPSGQYLALLDKLGSVMPKAMPES